MRHIARALVIGLGLACPALANAPDSSPRPQPAPTAPAETTLNQQATALSAGPARSLRPRPNPVEASAPAPAPIAQPARAAQVMALISVPRPAPRPGIAPAAPEQVQKAAAVRILPGKSAVVGKKGSVCGDPDIRGETLAPITSRVRGCGIENPVRVTAIDGITLSQSAVINCDTARAMKQWINTGLRPAFGRKEVASLRIAASYACRPRNGVKGAKISEHGRGNAIDISAIVLANGQSVVVSDDWRRAAGKPMKKAYRAACGIFGTTLGPEADRHHRDHLHFDIARSGGRTYCK